MAKSDVKSYIVGSKIIPDWINDFCSRGIIKFNYEDGELENVNVNIQMKTVKANVGDEIKFTKNGLSVIKHESILKKEEENVEEENDDIS